MNHLKQLFPMNDLSNRKVFDSISRLLASCAGGKKVAQTLEIENLGELLFLKLILTIIVNP